MRSPAVAKLNPAPVPLHVEGSDVICAKEKAVKKRVPKHTSMAFIMPDVKRNVSTNIPDDGFECRVTAK